MKTIESQDFISNFAESIKLVGNGVTIQVVDDTSGEVIGYFRKNDQLDQSGNRRLGSLAHENINISKEDLLWSDEELEEIGF